jgi:hypothetical protein
LGGQKKKSLGSLLGQAAKAVLLNERLASRAGGSRFAPVSTAD